MLTATPTLGSTATPSGKVAARKSKTGLAHAGVHVTSYTTPGSHAKATVDPPLVYNLGPYQIKIQDYDFKFIGIRGDGSTVVLTEITNVVWDDSSAVMTGSVTFQTPEWAARSGLVQGNEIEASYSADRGRTWTPMWRMQIVQPNRDFIAQAMTANLQNDLQRLVQSTDSFSFTAGKGHTADWTTGMVIQTILNKYGWAQPGQATVGQKKIKSMPMMTTPVVKWHLVTQHPLDVIHSALLREKNATGIKYSIALDAAGDVVISAYRRTNTMYQLGPALIGATLSAQLSERFATSVSVKTNPVYTYAVDANGHITRAVSSTLSVNYSTQGGTQLYGYVHRDLYSPDAKTSAKLLAEGKLFLASVANPINSWVVTLPGIPSLRRLDAVEIVMPQWGTSQVVWVSDARHTLDGTAGYSTELTLVYDDPYLDNWKTAIQAKLLDTATARSRNVKGITNGSTTVPKPKSALAHSSKTPALGGTTTPSGKTAVGQ